MKRPAVQLDLIAGAYPQASWAEWGPPGDDTSLERYALHRRWADGGAVIVIGLNPSTANDVDNDPTVRRDIGFAKAIGAGGLTKLNLYAYRETDPIRCRNAVMGKYGGTLSDADNNAAIERHAKSPFVTHIIAAWGAKKWASRRAAEVVKIVTEVCHRPLYALRITNEGYPEHTLYLPGKCRPFLWRESR